MTIQDSLNVRANPLTFLISFFSNSFSMASGVVLCVGAVLGIVGIISAPIQVDVQMQTKEKGFLQIYVDTGKGFNEMQSKRIRLSAHPDFSHYAISIRANGIRAIRIDPLEAQGQFELLGMQIDYLFWHRQWHGHRELNKLLSTHEVDVKSTGGATLSAQATGNDPSLVITDVEDLKHWQLAATIFFAMFGVVTAFLLLVVIRHFGGIKTALTNWHTPLFIIVITATLLRINYWARSGLPTEPSQLFDLFVDEGVYFSVAQYIMTHGLINYFLSEQSVMVGPTNPTYIALMYSIFNSTEAIRAVNLILSILTIVLVYKLSKAIFNKPIGLLAAGICAVNSLFIEYSPTLMTEPLFMFLFMAGVYYLVLTVKETGESFYQVDALISAVLFTLAILTRSIVLLLPFFLLFMIGMLDAYRGRREGKFSFPLLKRAALPLLLPILIVGILATKNYVIFDRFLVATGSGSALWLGSRPDTEGDDPLIRKRDYGVRTIVGSADPLSLQGDLLLIQAGKKNILQNPFDYAWWDIKKIGRLAIGNNLVWFGSRKNIVEWYQGTGRNFFRTINILFQIILTVIIAVYGVIGLATARQNVVSKLILASTIIYIILFSIPFLALQRYGLPVRMLLVIPAAALLYDVWNNNGKQRRAALIGAPFIIAIVLSILFMEN